MTDHAVVSPEAWREARLRLLEKEKAFTRLREELSRERRALPWERVEKEYAFDGPDGRETLADLFAGRTQLAVYHFMFAPDWEEGCKSCSWWADNFERNVVHLAHRDVTLVAISRAPFAKLDAFRRRMGWSFKWVSSGGGDFSYDFAVASSRPEAIPRISVFTRDDTGAVFHTYSCYSRGVEFVNAGYAWLDLVPKGRDENGLTPHKQAWVRHRDKYEE